LDGSNARRDRLLLHHERRHDVGARRTRSHDAPDGFDALDGVYRAD